MVALESEREGLAVGLSWWARLLAKVERRVALVVALNVARREARGRDQNRHAQAVLRPDGLREGVLVDTVLEADEGAVFLQVVAAAGRRPLRVVAFDANEREVEELRLVLQLMEVQCFDRDGVGLGVVRARDRQALRLHVRNVPGPDVHDGDVRAALGQHACAKATCAGSRERPGLLGGAAGRCVCGRAVCAALSGRGRAVCVRQADDGRRDASHQRHSHRCLRSRTRGSAARPWLGFREPARLLFTSFSFSFDFSAVPRLVRKG
jgi:hypothetical protein